MNKYSTSIKSDAGEAKRRREAKIASSTKKAEDIRTSNEHETGWN